MIRPRVNRRDPIVSCGQASRHNGRQNTVHRGVIQTLEEHKVLRVRGSRLAEPSYRLDHNMRVPHNVPARIDFLRAGQVSRLCVREPTGLEMTDRDLNGEFLVLGERFEVRRENELGRGHVIHTRNDAYWGRIT